MMGATIISPIIFPIESKNPISFHSPLQALIGDECILHVVWVLIKMRVCLVQMVLLHSLEYVIEIKIVHRHFLHSHALLSGAKVTCPTGCLHFMQVYLFVLPSYGVPVFDGRRTCALPLEFFDDCFSIVPK